MNIELNQRRKLFIVHLLSNDNELITDLIMKSRALGGYHLLNAANKKQLIKVNEKWTIKKCFEVQSMDNHLIGTIKSANHNEWLIFVGDSKQPSAVVVRTWNTPYDLEILAPSTNRVMLARLYTEQFGAEAADLRVPFLDIKQSFLELKLLIMIACVAIHDIKVVQDGSATERIAVGVGLFR